MPTPIETYIDSLKTYYEAVWQATPAGDADARRASFQRLRSAIDDYTGPAPLTADDSLPASWAALLNGADAAADLEIANRLLTARTVLNAAEEDIHEDELIRRRMVELSRDRLQNLLLNKVDNSALEEGELGTLSELDTGTTRLLAVSLQDVLTEDMTDAEALAILQGWIRRVGGLEAQVDQPPTPQQAEVALALGIQPPIRASLREYTLPQAKYLDALHIFQNVHEIENTDTLNQATIRKLMRAEQENGNSERADEWLAGIRNFGARATAVSRDVTQSVTGAIDGIVNGNGETPADGDTPNNDNPLDGIGRFIQGIFGGGDGRSISWGAILGGALSAGAAMLVSNALPPMFRWIGLLLAIPAFFAGARMGRNWDGNDRDASTGNDTQAAGGESPSRELAAGGPAQSPTANLMSREEARQLGLDLLAHQPTPNAAALANVDVSQPLEPATTAPVPPVEGGLVLRPAP